MVRIFAITTTHDSLQITPPDQKEVSFTITNNSDRHLEGQVKLRTQPPTDRAWLSLGGESELDFPMNATQKVTVRVDLPPNTPPGKYPFRLDVISTTNPDEDYSEGPTIAVDVQATTKPSFPWWILVVAGVVLAVGGVFTWLLFFRTVAVPKVTDLRLEPALERLNSSNLDNTQKQEVTSNSADVGLVVKQSPQPGEKVARGSTVALTVAIAPERVQVPAKVVGLKIEEAVSLLLQEGFTLGTTSGDKDTTVASTDPSAGSLQPKGTTINIVMQSPSGNPPTPVPICVRYPQICRERLRITPIRPNS